LAFIGRRGRRDADGSPLRALRHAAFRDTRTAPAACSAVLAGWRSLGEYNHAHLLNGAFAHSHNEVATAVLPRSSTTLIQLGAAAAVVAITTMLASLVTPAGRGPPRALASVLVGQDISTRFCVARR